MQKYKFGIAAVLLSALAMPAFASTIPFDDTFATATTHPNQAPSGWTTNFGAVDWLHTGDQGITCYNGSSGCVNLDGHTVANGADPGYLLTSTPFTLAANTQYKLTAFISGNQTVATNESVHFGFVDSLGNEMGSGVSTIVIPAADYNGAQSGSLFHEFVVLFTPTAGGNYSVFFNNGLFGDGKGAILGRVQVSAVPLPASAWLLVSGLLMLGLLMRRPRGGDMPAVKRSATNVHRESP